MTSFDYAWICIAVALFAAFAVAIYFRKRPVRDYDGEQFSDFDKPRVMPRIWDGNHYE